MKDQKQNQIPPPADLSARSKEIWRKITVNRACSEERRELLHQALVALDRADEAAAIVRTEGMVLVTKTTGAVHSNPAVKIEREFRQLFARIWGGMLGLTWNKDFAN